MLVNDVDWEVLEGGDTELTVVQFSLCNHRMETTSSSYLHCTGASVIPSVFSTKMSY